MKNNYNIAVAVTLMFLSLVMLTMALALTTRIKRLEADVEDLRLRVIYGVKP